MRVILCVFNRKSILYRKAIDLLRYTITRQGNDLKIDVLRKPTHTDRYLDFNSQQDIKHKN